MGMPAPTSDIDNASWSADPLERLRQYRESREYIGFLIEQTVAECRTSGAEVIRNENDGFESEVVRAVSWQRIADQLGMSRQSAWQRYRDAEPFA